MRVPTLGLRYPGLEGRISPPVAPWAGHGGEPTVPPKPSGVQNTDSLVSVIVKLIVTVTPAGNERTQEVVSEEHVSVVPELGFMVILPVGDPMPAPETVRAYVGTVVVVAATVVVVAATVVVVAATVVVVALISMIDPISILVC